MGGPGCGLPRSRASCPRVPWGCRSRTQPDGRHRQQSPCTREHISAHTHTHSARLGTLSSCRSDAWDEAGLGGQKIARARRQPVSEPRCMSESGWHMAPKTSHQNRCRTPCSQGVSSGVINTSTWRLPGCAGHGGLCAGSPAGGWCSGFRPGQPSLESGECVWQGHPGHLARTGPGAQQSHRSTGILCRARGER